MKSKKALFMDFYGTVVAEISPHCPGKLLWMCYQNSIASSPREVIAYWYKTFGEKTILYNGPTFKTQHDIAWKFFGIWSDFQCGCSPEALLARMEEHWCTSPIYEDAAAFLKQVSLPVYFVTNCDDQYVEAEIQKYGLHPAGLSPANRPVFQTP